MFWKNLADSFTVPVLVLFGIISANLRPRNKTLIGWTWVWPPHRGRFRKGRSHCRVTRPSDTQSRTPHRAQPARSFEERHSLFFQQQKLDLFSKFPECVLFSKLNWCALHIKNCILRNRRSCCLAAELMTQTVSLSIQSQADYVVLLQRFLTKITLSKVLFQQRYFITNERDKSSG